MKPRSKIGVDRPGGCGSSFASMNGPGADFLFTGGKESAEAKQMISAADERADARFGNSKLFEKIARLLK